MQVNMYGAAIAARKRSAEQTAQQGDQGDADKGNTAASHELFYPQLGVKLCSMAGGGIILLGTTLIPLLSGLF